MLLKEIPLDPIGSTTPENVTADQIMDAKASAFWRDWYPKHKDDAVGPKIHLLFISKQLHVHELHSVFEWIFGPETPVSA